MEKIFNARWWDYSKDKFNINGRISLNTLVLFAFAGIGIIKIFNPLINILISKISLNAVDIIFYVLLTVFLIDLVVSFVIICKIRNISSKVKIEYKDNTEEISKKVRAIILLKSRPYRRVLEAFPHVFADKIKSSKEKIVQVASDIKSNVKEAKDKTIENISYVKDKTIENINVVKEKTKENVSNVKEKAVVGMANIKEKAATNIKNIRTNRIEKASNKNTIERRKRILNSLKEVRILTISRKGTKESDNNENKS